MGSIPITRSLAEWNRGLKLGGDGDRSSRLLEPSPTHSDATWVEQDSNLRRQCHQIYSLAPLAAWVSTREFGHFLLLSVCPSSRLECGNSPVPPQGAIRVAAELTVRLELTTLGLQNRCSAG